PDRPGAWSARRGPRERCPGREVRVRRSGRPEMVHGRGERPWPLDLRAVLGRPSNHAPGLPRLRDDALTSTAVLPTALRGRLRLPVIGAPMFLVSGPELVLAQCRAGVVGAFPSLNARPASQFDEWLHHITESLAEHARTHLDAPAAP